MPSVTMDVDVDTTIDVEVDLDELVSNLSSENRKYLCELLGMEDPVDIRALAETVFYQCYGTDITSELRELLRAVTGRVI